ncbi:MAG: RlmE family RNA methyltransferase [Proteobacteria bacterium]|nr:RlmE family RNA methyltransferase [Pseudomonadota bacterium]
MCAEYNRKDKLYERAKQEGYRSRAAYKLLELNKKYSILRPGTKVFDLGAWPGGWTQVAAAAVGSAGLVVALDLVALEPLPEGHVHLLCGDAREAHNIEAALRLAGSQFDVVISDMSPKLTGIKEADQAGTVGCAELAQYVAGQVLKKGGDLVLKVFKGNDTELFVRQLRPLFEKVMRAELDSTRKTSNEYYVVARGFKGSA